EDRYNRRTYQNIYHEYNVYDCVQMNIAFGGRSLGRLALYRTRSYGPFTDQEVFYLRALSNHINLAYDLCMRSEEIKGPKGRSMEELTQTYQLTRREAEILGLIFQGLNNQELLDRLTISKNTLLKHLQNLYRKCGVSSRLDLLKLRS
ncbi:MAG: LuxR family transcriptional regulator, partial [Ruminiclostridium sp.]|nr:LuxR family transcriptional regulator [Ruminiclostridium sp.]